MSLAPKFKEWVDNLDFTIEVKRLNDKLINISDKYMVKVQSWDRKLIEDPITQTLGFVTNDVKISLLLLKDSKGIGEIIPLDDEHRAYLNDKLKRVLQTRTITFINSNDEVIERNEEIDDFF